MNLRDRYTEIKSKAIRAWDYVSSGVWRDTRNTLKVRLIKTGNLFVNSFLNSDLQSQACAMTYRTMLALVPALALIFAIGRGFGLQDVIIDQLYKLFPSQQQLLSTAFSFVDSYLLQASEGVFVGVGIVFLLWTLISLLGSVENTFNQIWRVREGRSFYRKVTDYMSIFIILPIFFVCAGGLQIFVSNTIQSLLTINFIGPALRLTLDLMSWIFTWLFFTAAYILVPKAKVKFTNAIIPGIVVGTIYQVLQWLFLSGQMYVAKYNAIYGSFSFLPLFLIWLQLVWLITLIGALMCYASQNIGQFNFKADINNISNDYRSKVTIVIMAIITKRFADSQTPLTVSQISKEYGFPDNLTTTIINKLKDVGLINFIAEDDDRECPVQPAVDIATLTIGDVINRLRYDGASDFIPDFDKRYHNIEHTIEQIYDTINQATSQQLIKDLEIN